MGGCGMRRGGLSAGVRAAINVHLSQNHVTACIHHRTEPHYGMLGHGDLWHADEHATSPEAAGPHGADTSRREQQLPSADARPSPGMSPGSQMARCEMRSRRKWLVKKLRRCISIGEEGDTTSFVSSMHYPCRKGYEEESGPMRRPSSPYVQLQALSVEALTSFLIFRLKTVHTHKTRGGSTAERCSPLRGHRPDERNP